MKHMYYHAGFLLKVFNIHPGAIRLGRIVSVMHPIARQYARKHLEPIWNLEALRIAGEGKREVSVHAQ